MELGRHVKKIKFNNNNPAKEAADVRKGLY
jgi:hypothetical protein